MNFFAKALGNLETCVLDNNNFCGKFVLSLELPAMFDDKLSYFSTIFIPHFHLLSCKLNNFSFKVLY